MKNEIEKWKKRNLTLEGRVKVIKTLVLSKIIFTASLMKIPDGIVKDIKKILFEYLWGGTDKVKRPVVVNSIDEGGLNMVDLDCFFTALKAAWVPRILDHTGKWKGILDNYLNKINLDIGYVLNMNFKSIKDFPILKNIPVFYQEVLISFNSVKNIIPLEKLSKQDFLQQSIFGNDLIKKNGKCIYFKGWLSLDIKYIKDVFDKNGNMKNARYFYDKLEDKRSVLMELHFIRSIILKYSKHLDASLAKHVKSPTSEWVVHGNKRYNIQGKKCSFFYVLLKQSKTGKNHMDKKIQAFRF